MSNADAALYARNRVISLVALAVLIALLSFVAARVPYFPGDIALARAIQAVVPIPTTLAQWITATALPPWCFILFSLTALVAWFISGWRATMLAFPIFFGLWWFGIWLSPLASQPRPSGDLINVVGHPKGFAFPSIFGLIYAASFGYVGLLAFSRLATPSAIMISILAALALVLGACARIVVGAHWPSDLWVAYLMGLFWIELLLPISSGDVVSSIGSS
jgi:membrane-associated phospholipid phosphatase